MHAVPSFSHAPGKTTRRGLLASAAGLAAPSLPRFARAAEITWRAGHSSPATFALHLRLLEAAKTIAERSEGQMTLEVHPDGELGSAVGLMAQVRAGTIDVVPLGCQMLGNDLALAALPMVGFAFEGYDQVWPALDGATGRFLRAQLNDRLGLVAMDRCWDFGFRQITTAGKSVNTAADLAGLRLRTPPEADFINLFHALKAVPMAMSLKAMMPALQAHTIDGQEGILQLVSAAGLTSVQSNCALTNHVWDGQWMCVSGKSWAKLSSKLKDVVASAFNESGLRQRQDILELNASIRTELSDKRMAFNTVEFASFRTRLRQSGYYAEWKARMGDDAWAALEASIGRLA